MSQKKSSRYVKQQENMTYTQGQKQSTESDPEMSRMLELAGTDFKSIIINMFKALEQSVVLMRND